MHSRTGSIMAAVAIAGGALVAVATTATTLAVAAPNALNVSATSVAVGSSITASPSGCAGSGSGTFVRPEIELITGTGSSARLAALPSSTGEDSYTLSVPGWADPAQPAVVAGRCVTTTVAADGTQTSTTTFTYADVPVDVTPGPAGVPAPTITLDRSTAAAGQDITVSATGCAPNSLIQAILLDGSDLSGRGSQRFIATGITDDFVPSPSGSAELELTLNLLPAGVPAGFPGAGGAIAGSTVAAAGPTQAIDGQPDGGPLNEGGYIALVACRGPEGPVFTAEPKPVQVVGTNPTGSLRLDDSEASVLILATGEGCTGGREVTVTSRFTVFAVNPGDGPPVPVVTTSTATPDADGSWATSVPGIPNDSFSGFVSADCGDPTADGFRYVSRPLGGGPTPGPPVIPGPTTTTTLPTPATPPPPAPPSVPSAPGAPALPGQGNYTG